MPIYILHSANFVYLIVIVKNDCCLIQYSLIIRLQLAIQLQYKCLSYKKIIDYINQCQNYNKNKGIRINLNNQPILQMKLDSNQFMSNLSSDILSQNHHLKMEVIKIKKILNNYQHKMVEQFVRLSDDLELNKNQAFIFQTPQQYLDYFVQVVKSEVERNKLITQKIGNCERQYRKIKLKYQSFQKQLQQGEDKLQKAFENIKILQNCKKSLQEKLQNAQKQLKDRQLKSEQQAANLKQSLLKQHSQFNIKLLEQKKLILEKNNKQIAGYRAEMDLQLHKKQKLIKIQCDKRDKEVKALLNALNSLIEKKQVEAKDNQKNSKMLMKSIDFGKAKQGMGLSIAPIRGQQQQGSNNLKTLVQVVKPFTEHTNILQKLSESRKQALQLKNQLRQCTTNLSSIKLQYTQILNELQLIKQKNSVYHQKNEQMSGQLSFLREELQKSNNDKQAMQKYYSERWNSQLNKVKHHVEKKYENKQKQLDEQYFKLRQQLELRKNQIIQQAQKLKQQASNLRNENKKLSAQISRQENEKMHLKNHINQFEKKMNERIKIHEEEKLSLKIHFEKINENALRNLKQKQDDIVKLLQQIESIKEQNAKNIENIIAEAELKMNTCIQQITKEKDEQIAARDDKIQKFITEIQSHKSSLESLLKQQPQKRDMIVKKVTKQKQRQINMLKVSYCQQINKLNQKILKLEQRIKQVKNLAGKKETEFYNSLMQKQKKIKQLQLIIVQKDETYKLAISQIKNAQKQYTQLKIKFTHQQLRMSEMELQIKSHNLILKGKQDEIQRLMLDKLTWNKDIEYCKKQFEKGFKQLKDLNQRKVSHLRSRIWELQMINESGIISKKDFEKIRNLTEDKKKLQQKVTMKQAENLILKEVQKYYQKKTQQLDTKLAIQFELKEPKKQIFIRKPKRDGRNFKNLKNLKTQICEYIGQFDKSQIVQVRRAGISSRNKPIERDFTINKQIFSKTFHKRQNRNNSSLI